MAFEDEELLQDFLIEAGEILEQLGEQLVELENRVDDSELLNAVFRGFHTIKGGASFLSLDGLVGVCHVSEDVFNLLRNGERQVDSNLMDVFFQVLDVLNAMFDSLRSREEPEHASPELIAKLKAIHAGEAFVDLDDSGSVDSSSPKSSQEDTQSDHPENLAESNNEDLADKEFEELLDVLDDAEQGNQTSTGAAAEKAGDNNGNENSGDVISEDEFDQLLDELHGEGKSPGSTESANQGKPESASPVTSQEDEITEQEFDKLLDDLHGEGKHSSREEKISSTQKNTTIDAVSAQSDEINDEEFENLLDEIHGKGKHQKSTQHVDTSNPNTPVSNQVPDQKLEPPEKKIQAAVKPTDAKEKSVTPMPSDISAKNQSKPKTSNATMGADNVKTRATEKKEAPVVESTVRVDTKRLDDIMNMVGELVLARNRLVTLQSSMAKENDEISQAIANLDLVTGDLQSAVMKTRMQPIKKVFGRFPRVVRDLARSLKKEVQLDLVGEETDLDKNLVEALADPLVHLVRNSVDHGIEMPDVREAAGKPRAGKVILAAEQEGDHILLSITDDGAGMDPNKLRKIVVEKGVMDEESASRLDDKEAFNLIFSPGFSTKTEISDVSGRGVGMDVVKTSIVKLNGSIDIESTIGKGTRLVIKVPLTLAIMPTLMVRLGNQTFALPLVSVSEIFNLDLSNTNLMDGQEIIMLRDRPLPIYFLADWLIQNSATEHPKAGHVVVVSIGNQKVGFVVEHLVGQEEVVIKPLGALLQGTEGLAGATITGDGRIALILDIPSLVKAYAN